MVIAFLSLYPFRCHSPASQGMHLVYAYAAVILKCSFLTIYFSVFSFSSVHILNFFIKVFWGFFVFVMFLHCLCKRKFLSMSPCVSTNDSLEKKKKKTNSTSCSFFYISFPFDSLMTNFYVKTRSLHK